MKQIISLFLLIVASLYSSSAMYGIESDVVILQPEGFTTLKVPEKKFLDVKKTSVISHQNNNDQKYSDLDDEVFESKTGKIFSHFVENRVINNKFSNMIDN